MRASGLLKVVRYESEATGSPEHSRREAVHLFAFILPFTAYPAVFLYLDEASSPYRECHAKPFSQQKGLKAHLKVHEGRAVDGRLDAGEDTVNDDKPVVKRRRGREHGRDWVCDFEGCTKDFKSVCSCSRFRRRLLTTVL